MRQFEFFASFSPLSNCWRTDALTRISSSRLAKRLHHISLWKLGWMNHTHRESNATLRQESQNTVAEENKNTARWLLPNINEWMDGWMDEWTNEVCQWCAIFFIWRGKVFFTNSFSQYFRHRAYSSLSHLSTIAIPCQLIKSLLLFITTWCGKSLSGNQNTSQIEVSHMSFKQRYHSFTSLRAWTNEQSHQVEHLQQHTLASGFRALNHSKGMTNWRYLLLTTGTKASCVFDYRSILK